MNLPKHIAIIMDGNGRWAKKRNMPRVFGHKKGVEVVDNITKKCSTLGIQALTLYAFSTENWKRSKDEINALMNLLEITIKEQKETIKKSNIQFNVIGDVNVFSSKLKEAIDNLRNETKENTGMLLTLALNYGSRQEIMYAIKEMYKEIQKIELNIDSLNMDFFEQFLYTKNLPGLDFIIRTSGEMRLSNFLLWQAAYAEIYVTDVLWPDFNEIELEKALNEYNKRERRFGQ